MKHVILVKKPDAFQLGSNDADDPKVQKTIAQLGIGAVAKMPKPLQLVIAQLAFANSDLAFQGNHVFQGNFYGVTIYDISNPLNASLLTSMAACRNFRPSLRPRQDTKRNAACPPRKRIASAAFESSTFPTSRTQSKLLLCKPAAVRIPILWCKTRTTRTTFISTSPAYRLSVKPKNFPAAPAKSRTRIQTQHCFASR